MRPQARERIPTAAAAYLEAYVALELSARKAQALIDQLTAVVGALNDTGTRIRADAWKFASVKELTSWRAGIGALRSPIRLASMPRANQVLEAIADWRKKRSYLQALWENLPLEIRATLKEPETLD